MSRYRSPEAPTRVDCDDAGDLDEVVGCGRYHLERLGDGCWFLDLGGLALTLNACVTLQPWDRWPRLRVPTLTVHAVARDAATWREAHRAAAHPDPPRV